MRFNLLRIAAACGIILTHAAHAKDTAGPDPAAWPARMITWLVGFPPGGSTDTLTRIAAKELARETGLTVLVENRPGASGVIALQALARSKPSDGYLLTLPGPAVYPTPQPEVGREVTPVILLTQGPMVIAGPAKGALPTLQDVLENARRQPDAWSYGTSGNGTSQHLAGELLNQAAGTRIMHVPYKGGAQAVNDLAGGQIPLAVLGTAALIPQVKAGTIKAYAVTTRHRLDNLPQVPTVGESGFPDYDASQWSCVVASSGITPAQRDRINAALRKVIQTPAFQAAMQNEGMTAGGGSPEELRRFIEADTAKWRAIIDSGVLQAR